MVRHDLGPDAAVLHTREVQSRRFFGWFNGPRQIEVTASRDVNVPSRLPERAMSSELSAMSNEQRAMSQARPEAAMQNSKLNVRSRNAERS